MRNTHQNGATKNPYELGKKDATGKIPENNGYNNPFPEFSEKWALYNVGYNTTKYPEYFKI